MVKNCHTADDAAAAQSTREPTIMDEYDMREYDMREYDNMEHVDSQTLLNSYIVYVTSLCIGMLLYCVVYVLLLWYLGPPPPPHHDGLN